MLNPATRSKNKKRGRSTRHRLVVILLVLLALGLTVGPSLILNVALMALPQNEGSSFTYSKARAGFLFKEVVISELAYSSTVSFPPWSVTVQEIRLKGFSLINSLRLWLGSPEEHLTLTRHLSLRNLNLERHGDGLSLASLELSNPEYLIQPPEKTLVLFFNNLRLEDLNATQGPAKLALKKLYVRRLGPETLEEFTVAGLELTDPVSQTELNLEIFTLGQVPTTDLIRFMEGEPPANLWRFLMALPELNMKEASYTRGEKQKVYFKTVLFESKPQKEQEPASYRRYMNFSFTADDQIKAHLENVSGFKITEITGPELKGELDFSWTHQDQPGGQTHIRQASLHLEQLGYLNLNGKLQGLQHVNPYLTPAQLLFTSLAWKLEELSLRYQDKGLASKLYPWVDKNVLNPYEPGSTPFKIKKFLLKPWVDVLREEAGLADLPALTQTLEEFIEHPESIFIEAKPEQPLGLTTLANLNKYDIIGKLRVSLEVNRNQPVPVTVATGVAPEILNTTPQHIDKLFTEEDI